MEQSQSALLLNAERVEMKTVPDFALTLHVHGHSKSHASALLALSATETA
jgi:hypothetical protein